MQNKQDVFLHMSLKGRNNLCWNNQSLALCAFCNLFITTYLLIPRSSVLLEKLTSSQLIKKFLAFYGTRRFNIAFTSARHLSLSWARSIQSMPPHPTSWRSSLILSSLLHPGSCHHTSRVWTRGNNTISDITHLPCVTHFVEVGYILKDRSFASTNTRGIYFLYYLVNLTTILCRCQEIWEP
jgi:hypothetical protein